MRTTPTLSWHATYGGWRSTGHGHDYLVARFKSMWATFYRPRSDEPHDPYAMLPHSTYRTRREAQQLAEDHEVKQLAKS